MWFSSTERMKNGQVLCNRSGMAIRDAAGSFLRTEKEGGRHSVYLFFGRSDRIRTYSRKRCKHRLRQSGGCPHSLAFICLGQIKSNRSGMAMQDAAGSFLRIEKERGRHSVYLFLGRDDRIRTCGLCVPNAALYQAEPHLEANYLIIRMKWYFVKSF